MIVKARGYVSVFFHGLENPETLLEPPDPKSHPALIAKHMLYLATFLQHLHPAVHEEIKGLSETPKVIVQRLANTAISLVTTNDELIGSIEGLECVKLEAAYWLNWGNLRRSLIVMRRAVVIAQLMGLHRSAQYKILDPKTKVDSLAMWYQILHCERALCLQLGLPQASHDHSMGSDALLASDIPIGRLERMHSVISSLILARNETIGSFQDFTQTQKLDMELQKAAKLVPSKWWLIPSLTDLTHDALSAETRRIFDQMCHYNLLNLLHLPHLLRSSAEHKFEYSRMMCVNASREILSRFNAFRSYNRVASSFRAIDFLAFIAGTTLLLAHLDSHRFSPADNLLAHQSFSDRAMIEQVQDNMVEVGRLNTDPLSVQSADLLRRLSTIELQVADGNINPAANLQSPLHTQNLDKVRDEHDNRIVPDANGGCIVSELCARFGLIQMCNDETLFKLRHPEPSRSQTQPSSQPSQIANPTMPSSQAAAASAEMPGFNGAAALQPAETVPYPQLFPATTEAYQYADLTAGVEDWAFQGVDMAFVDSLMRGAGEDEAWFH
ncbi:hypothetical protein L207DRAFT_511553 [Hyaloscypha variabilis F]|uniref:Transcription factor domain-containing protein n=1 Tax=Hyaloscypha variabilis (strain UAMH 11265 / GT02V1 / F) TaxID=1149755 RepID=A0A2J6RTB8_HYAVF|nr:hypothetical protein L207DRAFT_511553 [Hyaloscypha variabilis F]